MRIRTDTFDHWPIESVNGTLTEDTKVQRSGKACAACAKEATALLEPKLASVLGRTYYERVAVRLSALPASTSGLWRAVDATGTVLEMSITSAGRIRMWNGVAGAHPTETEFLAKAEEWVVLEMLFMVPKEGNGQVAWRANEKEYAAPQAMNVRNLGMTVTRSGNIDKRPITIYLDDFARNDNTGTTDNTWPGLVADPAPTVPACMWGALAAGDHYKAEWDKAPYQKETWDEFEKNAGRKMGYVHAGDPWLTWDGYGAGASAAVFARGETVFKDLGTIGAEKQLAEVLEGKYDAQIKAWAEAAAAYGKRVLLRPWWEMNGTWFPWGQDETNYVKAWRYLHERIKPLAPKVEFIYCPNTVYDAASEKALTTMYPGDAYVDWLGIDGYTGENPLKKLGWKAPSELFEPTCRLLRELSPTKGIIICETACSETGGNKAAWITNLLNVALPYDMPEVKGLVWFNWAIAEGEGKLDWQIESSEAATKAFAAGVANVYYQPASPTVTTLPATGIVPTKATLNGTVNPNGLPTDYCLARWRKDWQTSGWPSRTNRVVDPLVDKATAAEWRNGGTFKVPTKTEAWPVGGQSGKWELVALPAGTYFAGAWNIAGEGRQLWQVTAGEKYSLIARFKNEGNRALRLQFFFRKANGAITKTVEVEVPVGEGWLTILTGVEAPAETDHCDLVLIVVGGPYTGTVYWGEHILEQRSTAILDSEFFPRLHEIASTQAVENKDGSYTMATPEYAPVSKEGDAGEGQSEVAVSETVTGLENKVRYKFRLVAKNDA